jgi:hypothetical protein
MRTYEFWCEHGSGSIFAIALEDGVVVGSCGPLDHGEIDEALLARYPYTAGRAEWIEAHREEFGLHAAPASS